MQSDDLTAAEVAAILDAADNLPLLVAMRLMVECGLRVGEVTSLRSLHVSYNLGGRFWLDTGRHKVQCPDDLAFDLLSLESDPELPLVRYDASNVYRAVRRAAERAGIEKRVNTHALRCYWQSIAR